MNRKWIGVVLASLLVAGCLISPKNNDTLTSQTQPIYFSAFYPADTGTIQIYQYNLSTSNWDAVPNAMLMPTPSPVKDSQGTLWTRFLYTGTVQSQSQYWYELSSGQCATKIKAIMGGGQTLMTFEGGANTQQTENCWQKYESQGGYAMAQNCESSASPVVQLIVPYAEVPGGCHLY